MGDSPEQSELSILMLKALICAVLLIEEDQEKLIHYYWYT